MVLKGDFIPYITLHPPWFMRLHDGMMSTLTWQMDGEGCRCGSAGTFVVTPSTGRGCEHPNISFNTQMALKWFRDLDDLGTPITPKAP